MNIRTTIYTVLRKSERFFRTDMIYLTKGGSLLASGNVISALFSFFLGIAFANLLPKEIYGNYKYVLSIAGLLGAFTLSGLGTSITRSVSKGYEGSLEQGFRTAFLWNTGVSVLSFIAALYYFINENTFLGWSLIIVGIFASAYHSAPLYGAHLEGKKEFQTRVIYNIIRNGLSAAALFVTLLLTNNPLILVLVYFTSNTLLALYFFRRTLLLYRSNSFTQEGTVEYGKHLSFMNVLSSAVLHLDKILVFHYLGAAELAIYVFASVIPEQLRGIFKHISTLAMPKLSMQEKEDMRSSIHEKTLRLLIILSGVSLLYVFTAPYIFHFLFPQYESSVVFSQVIVLSLIASVPAILPATALKVVGATKELYYISAITGVLHLAILIPLVAVWGIWGAVTTLILGKGVKTLVVFYFFERFFKKRFS